MTFWCGSGSGTFTSFFRGKKSKRSHKTVEIKGFSYYFCLIIEGSGSTPLTNGSGSRFRRPKNTWIRWIRIRIRIRIRNTAISAGEDPALAWEAVRIRRPAGGAHQEARPRGAEGGGGGCYQVGLWRRMPRQILIRYGTSWKISV